MKECKQCNAVLTFDSFYVGHARCKDCYKAIVKEHREKNKEYYKAYDAARAMRPDRVKARMEYQKTDAGKEAVRRAKRKWRESNTVKRAAGIIVGNAIRSGKIEKPSACSECGKSSRIHGHHDDYSKPLDVRWLCSKCHINWHKENGPGLNG